MMKLLVKKLIFISLLFMNVCAGLACVSTISQTKRASSLKAYHLRARVVIDPGHGGKDAGAVGKRGLLEKHVTLDIARRIKRVFAKMMPNVDVVITRTSDRYVSLKERVLIANRRPADVFVSLHVNASESGESNGFEIFSLDVASDRHAERLAARENSENGEAASNLQFILADLRATSNRKLSDRLASLVSRGLKMELRKIPTASPILDRGYNQAIFQVLFVNMPGILAELFFISNSEEEDMLSKKASREHIARGIYLGVRKFLLTKR